jgi:hypothetical protein
MTAKALDTHILIDEFEVSRQSTGLTVESSVDSEDSTTFQATAAEFTLKLPSPKLSLKGLMTGIGSSYLENELQSRIGTQTTIVAGLLGTATAACPGYCIPSSAADNMKIDSPVAGLISIEGGFIGSRMYRGIRIFHNTISAVGAQTGVDLGASGSAGGNVFMFVTAISGTATNADIDIESDSDSGFGSAATEATHTFSAVGATQVSMSGTIGRYVRLNCTDLGGATSFDVVAICCVDGVTM